MHQLNHRGARALRAPGRRVRRPGAASRRKRYAHAVARCNRWPGAFAAASGAKYANVYVGYGHESTGTTFTPVPPPPMLGEAADPDEEDDVTLDAENALLKQIDEETRVADEEAGGEEADE